MADGQKSDPGMSVGYKGVSVNLGGSQGFDRGLLLIIVIAVGVGVFFMVHILMTQVASYEMANNQMREAILKEVQSHSAEAIVQHNAILEAVISLQRVMEENTYLQTLTAQQKQLLNLQMPPSLRMKINPGKDWKEKSP